MNLHRRQYVIAPHPVSPGTGWTSCSIDSGLSLSCCSELRHGTASDLDGRTWHLLGLAVETDANRPAPLEMLRQSRSEEVPLRYRSWAGRWLLIGAGAVHLDCMGLLGCFYTKHEGSAWVSGSLGVLSACLPLEPRPEVLRHKSSVEWFPLPASRFKGVSKLLPSQVLRLENLEPAPRPLPAPLAGRSYDTLLTEIGSRMKVGIMRASAMAKRTFLALTSGHDSRLVLALAAKAGVPLTTYTQEHHRISSSDFTVPRRLANIVGYPHCYIWKKPFSIPRDQLYDQHTGGNINDLDRLMFAHGQWDMFRAGDLVLRGGGFEFGRCGYWKRIGPEMDIAGIIKDCRMDPQAHAGVIADYQQWFAWIKQHPTPGMDWRDRFYLEQRAAGWLSALEQSLDLTNAERFFCVNCHDICSLLLTIPVDLRGRNQHHVDLIGRMAPGLLRYPFNEKATRWQKWRSKAVRMSHLPIPELYKVIRRKLSPPA